MAKKGGVQQLQSEINTTEELRKFLDRNGLIVLDVYTEWCGPCLAMIGSLKKIKLEQGGDDLHLAIVKCDNIDAFERFRNRSEPTWLLASKGRLVNSACGANVPHLIELILKELDIERRTRDTDPETSGRLYYDLNEMTLVERKRFESLQKIEEENERIEQESAQQSRLDYLTCVTDTIMKNSYDMGVTVLMPHVISRDLFKRLSDPADKCHLIAKDKKNVQVLREHIDTIETCASESMSSYLVDHILNREVFVVCWKVTDNNISENGKKTVEESLSTFVQFVWHDDETTNASILKALSVIAETEKNVDGDLNEDDDSELEKCIDESKPIEESKQHDEQEMADDENLDRKKFEKDENAVGETDQSEIGFEEDENAQTDDINRNHTANKQNRTATPAADENDESNEKSYKYDESKTSERTTPITTFKAKNQIEIKIPPIWTPADKRANAAMIYLYFRSLTEAYLPPDLPVERPHLALVFDAYKRHELMGVIEAYRDDVLAYGYFTTDNCETAQLIANSTFDYNKNPPTIYDKLILKVAKTKNSAILVAMKKLGPSYISKNTEIGKNECLSFFPRGYKNSSETGETKLIPVDKKPKKKKKKRQTKQPDEENENQTQSVTQTPTDVEAADDPEDGTEQDGDDSADDDSTAGGNGTEELPETTET